MEGNKWNKICLHISLVSSLIKENLCPVFSQERERVEKTSLAFTAS